MPRLLLGSVVGGVPLFRMKERKGIIGKKGLFVKIKKEPRVLGVRRGRDDSWGTVGDSDEVIKSMLVKESYMTRISVPLTCLLFWDAHPFDPILVTNRDKRVTMHPKLGSKLFRRHDSTLKYLRKKDIVKDKIFLFLQPV